MIPLYLYFEGLTSYQHKTQIDFRPLLEARLFGVFGQTAAGKSSLLEAMMIALYGVQLRGDKRSVEPLINAKTGQLHIRFVFQGFDKQLYACNYNRKKSNKSGEHTFYVSNSPNISDFQPDLPEQANQWKPISGEEFYQKALGLLSYSHFTQTVFLPQGQFDSLLQMKSNDRASFLQEIFQLNQYDFEEAIKVHFQQAKQTYELAQEQLRQYESISQEQINLLKAQQESLVTQIGQLTKQIQHLQHKQQTLLLLHKKQEEAEQLKQKISQLESSIDISGNELERRQEQLKIAIQEFQPLLIHLNNLAIDIKQTRQEYESKQQEQYQLQSDYEKKKEQWNIHKKRYEEELAQIRNYILQAGQLKHLLIDIKKATEEQTKAKQEYKKLQEEAKQIQEQQTTLEKHIKEIEHMLETIEAHGPEQIIAVCNSLLPTLNHIVTQYQNCKKNLEALLKPIAQQFEQTYAIKLKDYFKKQDFTALQELQLQLQSHLQEIEEQWLSYEVQQKLQALAQQLQAGKPCPLCGSSQHPHPYQHHDVQPPTIKPADARESLNALSQLLTEFRQSKENYQAWIKNFKHQRILKEYIDTHKLKAPDELKILNKALDFATRQHQNYLQLKQKLEQYKQKHKEQFEYLHKKQNSISAIKEKLNNLEETLQDKYQSKELFCKEQNFPIHLIQIDTLEQQIEQWKKECQLIESQYKTSLMQEEETKQKLFDLNGQIKQLSDQCTKKQKDYHNCQEQLKHYLRQHSHYFQHLGQVEQILQQKEKIEIQSQQYAALRQHKVRLELLEQELKTQQYSPADYNELCRKLDNLQQEKSQLDEQNGKLKQRIEQEESQLHNKQIWQEKLNQASSQYNLWKEMLVLFSRKQFIYFILEQYLRQLCHQTNIYLQELMQEGLQLYLEKKKNKKNNSDSNFEFEFCIYDPFYNQRRPISTLSGGQRFLLSLSLALALSSMIQKRYGVKQHFFFIDEGFGSLDPAALQTVMGVLTNLAKERVIGIISHVKDIQDMIGTALIIEKNHRGSQIKQSWDMAGARDQIPSSQPYM